MDHISPFTELARIRAQQDRRFMPLMVMMEAEAGSKVLFEEVNAVLLMLDGISQIFEAIKDLPNYEDLEETMAVLIEAYFDDVSFGGE